MSISKLMGKSTKELKTLNPEEGFEIFAERTQHNNHMIDKPPKYEIAFPASLGILLGVSIAYISRSGGSR